MTGSKGGCSSTNCFRIKTLVAIISFLVLIMALSEAVPIHRKRHNRKNIENFRKHDSFLNRTTQSQLLQRQQNNLHKNETKKIKQKLEQILEDFTEHYKKINLPKKERSGNPSWLPKVNFVSIHSRTNKLARNVKQRFRFMLPKLYRNLYHFKLMFQRLHEIQSRECNIEYGRNYANIDVKLHLRQNLLNFTFSEINMVMEIINDALIRLDYSPINLNSTRIDLSQIEMKVGITKCLQQDLVAYRSFEKTMKNWISEIECWFPVNRKSCTDYEERLKNRRKKRRNQA